MPNPTVSEQEVNGQVYDIMDATARAYMEAAVNCNQAYATSIPENADMDDYTSPGNYKVTTQAIASSLSHYPSNAAGRLTVITTVSANVIHQQVIDNNNREYTRMKTNDGWTAWTTTAFPIMTSYAFTTDIPENSDLDDYTYPGNYRIATVAIASSLSHCPTTVGSRLTVITLVGSNSIYQHIIDTNNREYTRQKSNAGWSDWKSSAFTVITSAAYTDAIPADSDLDSYTIPGNFRIATAAISRTIKNYPSSVGGRVFVFTINGTNSVLQVVTDTEDRTYTRTKSASGWANWNIVQYDSNRLQKIGARSIHSAMKPIMAAQTYDIAFANAPASIDMTNYIGNDQNVHPKVLYISAGFGGHKYWMAYTPYPHSFDKFENPCIAYSDDGYAWSNIEGNPIDDPNGVGYNSDTHLVYNGSTLECWYRLVDDESANPRKETLKRRVSIYGLTWSASETVLENSSGNYANLLSPAVIYESGKYCMWVVNGASSPVAIDYYESTSLPTWTKVRTITLTYTDRGSTLDPWHLDVIKENGQYILLVMGRNGTTKNSKWTLFLSTSNDNITYTTPAVIVKGSSGWDQYMYRSSIVKVPDGYRIYYSACGNGNVESNSVYNRAIWGIGITEATGLTNFIGTAK